MEGNLQTKINFQRIWEATSWKLPSTSWVKMEGISEGGAFWHTTEREHIELCVLMQTL